MNVAAPATHMRLNMPQRSTNIGSECCFCSSQQPGSVVSNSINHHHQQQQRYKCSSAVISKGSWHATLGS